MTNSHVHIDHLGYPPVDAYLDALVNQGFEDYPLAEDVIFRGPRLGPLVGASQVRPVLISISAAFAPFDVSSPGTLVQGDDAVLLLDVELPDGRGFAIADHLRFANGQLIYLRPYFDAGILETLGAAPSVDDLGAEAHL